MTVKAARQYNTIRAGEAVTALKRNAFNALQKHRKRELAKARSNKQHRPCQVCQGKCVCKDAPMDQEEQEECNECHNKGDHLGTMECRYRLCLTCCKTRCDCQNVTTSDEEKEYSRGQKGTLHYNCTKAYNAIEYLRANASTKLHKAFRAMNITERAPTNNTRQEENKWTRMKIAYVLGTDWYSKYLTPQQASIAEKAEVSQSDAANFHIQNSMKQAYTLIKKNQLTQRTNTVATRHYDVTTMNTSFGHLHQNATHIYEPDYYSEPKNCECTDCLHIAVKTETITTRTGEQKTFRTCEYCANKCKDKTCQRACHCPCRGCKRSSENKRRKCISGHIMATAPTQQESPIQQMEREIQEEQSIGDTRDVNMTAAPTQYKSRRRQIQEYINPQTEDTSTDIDFDIPKEQKQHQMQIEDKEARETAKVINTWTTCSMNIQIKRMQNGQSQAEWAQHEDEDTQYDSAETEYSDEVQKLHAATDLHRALLEAETQYNTANNDHQSKLWTNVTKAITKAQNKTPPQEQSMVNKTKSIITQMDKMRTSRHLHEALSKADPTQHFQ